MKSQIRAAYVAGLCPLLELTERALQGPDRHRNSLPVASVDETSADLPSKPSRRKRAALLLLTVGLAIAAWQLRSLADETRSAEASALASAVHGVLRA